MTARVIYQIADYDGEKSTVGFNLDALANEAALRTALDAVTIGVIQVATKIDSTVAISGATAASQYAQREMGLRIHFNDGTLAERGYATVAAPDLTALTLDTAGDVTLTDASVMAALVTEINTHVLSRDGNAILVYRAEIVGRNN